ncbi:MAG TPA: ankyrin repeat domain-containing protein [Trichocoleus sp.]
MRDPALELHEAFVRGDLEAVRRSFGDATDFPNVYDECGTSCLIYALYHSPLSLVRQLLELGANPNEPVQDGFPPLFVALDSNCADQAERVALLLEFGADVQQRGVNDYTALHYAASRDNAEAVTLLLSHGADPQARTRIDHYATPLEEAEYFGHCVGADALRRAADSHL